jgi:hypothetical protein
LVLEVRSCRSRFSRNEKSKVQCKTQGASATTGALYLQNDVSASHALYWLLMRLWFTLLLAALAIPALYGVEKKYDTGKIVDIQQKTKTRILYYQVDTPVTKDDPYFEISVQVKDTIYVGEYSPRHSADTLPEEWNIPNAEVRLRLEKHYMFLTRPLGTELQCVITKRIPVAPAKKTSEPPSSAKK